MKWIDVLMQVIGTCETVAQRAYDQNIISDSDVVPVEMWGLENRKKPCIYVDDRPENAEIPSGAHHADGLKKDDSGNVVGRWLNFHYSGQLEIVVAHEHQTESYRLISALQTEFQRAEEWPKYIATDVTNVNTEPATPKGVQFNTPTETYQQKLPVQIWYEDRILDDDVSELESITNNYTLEGDSVDPTA